MTHFICVSWPMFIYVTWLISTHVIHVTRLVHSCNMTHVYISHYSHTHVGKGISHMNTRSCCAHYNLLQHTATHCNTLQHTATHCNTLYYTIIHCNTLQHTAVGTGAARTATHYHTLHCNSQQHTASHCNALQHTATGTGPARTCIMGARLHHWGWVVPRKCAQDSPKRPPGKTATHCNTLQLIATHCNTLQHTARHCNTPSCVLKVRSK